MSIITFSSLNCRELCSTLSKIRNFIRLLFETYDLKKNCIRFFSSWDYERNKLLSINTEIANLVITSKITLLESNKGCVSTTILLLVFFFFSLMYYTVHRKNQWYQTSCPATKLISRVSAISKHTSVLWKAGLNYSYRNSDVRACVRAIVSNLHKLSCVSKL